MLRSSPGESVQPTKYPPRGMLEPSTPKHCATTKQRKHNKRGTMRHLKDVVKAKEEHDEAHESREFQSRVQHVQPRHQWPLLDEMVVAIPAGCLTHESHTLSYLTTAMILVVVEDGRTYIPPSIQFDIRSKPSCIRERLKVELRQKRVRLCAEDSSRQLFQDWVPTGSNRHVCVPCSREGGFTSKVPGHCKGFTYSTRDPREHARFPREGGRACRMKRLC